MRQLFFTCILLLIFSCHSNEKNGKSVSTESKAVSIDTILGDINKPISFENPNNIIAHTKITKDTVYYLKHFYRQFLNQKDSVSEVSFFKWFPDSFERFNSLYGYDNVLGEKPLYKEGINHILDYSKLRKYVSDIDYYNKLINISIGGHWEADNISMLQEVLSNNFQSESALFLELLQKKSKPEIESFWLFFFDGPHPDDPKTTHIYNEVLNSLESLNKGMVPVVKRAYAKVKKDWKEH
ncbi:hypothetical protein [Flagellimonas sp. C4]|uniref:hypothetical protein n=1 Tax=Flagellimonas alginolytica TaxID=3177515 RepID=UPI0035C8DDE9